MIRKPRPLIASRPVPPREPSRLTSSVIRPAFAAIPPATCTDDAASAAFRASARICPAGLAASPLALPAELPDEPLEELPPHAAASATAAPITASCRRVDGTCRPRPPHAPAWEIACTCCLTYSPWPRRGVNRGGQRMRVRRLMVGMAAVTAWLGLTVPAQAAIVGSKPIPSYQTNGRVVVVVVSGTTAYIGGKFTSVRPAGAAAGTGEVARNHVAAIDLTTGNVLPWNPNASSVVDAITVSGSTVYIGGSFATVGGKSRARIAAVDASTGAVLTAFKASVNAEVRAIELSNGHLYVGGAFTTPRAYTAT